MSFNIFVSTFRNEDTFNFPASEIESRFAPIIIGQRHGSWHLGFKEHGSFGEIPVPSEAFVDGFSVRNPPDNLEFWRIVAAFLRDFGSVLYWPGGGAVITSLELLQHLPSDMIESVGVPWVTADPERIRRYVRENS